MLSRVIQHNPMTPTLQKNLGDRGFSSVANCTDEQVHQSSLDAKKAQEQARRSKIFVQNQKKIMVCMKKLEELALELLKYGLKTDEENSTDSDVTYDDVLPEPSIDIPTREKGI